MTEEPPSEPNATFDINQFLAEATVAWGEKAWDKLTEYKKKFLDKWTTQKFEKRFGFSTDVDTAKKIYEIGDDVSFETLEKCIGKRHWALDFVRVGIFISQLSDKGERTAIDNIIEDIRKTKGLRPLNILRMGSTGAIKGVIVYLNGLIANKYSIDSVTQEFERIIYEWENITIFISKETTEEMVKHLIINKMKNNLLLFFVFSYGEKANANAMCAIADLNKRNIVRENNYIFYSFPRYDGVGTQIYMWSFEKFMVTTQNN